MDTLNEKQLEAVKCTEGYVRVIAGPGSGKTRVLAHRFAYLVNELGVSANSILAITFTNKAAKEMKQRIEELICEPVGDYVCTIHSFCKTFLREEIFRLNLPKNFDIMDETDCVDLLKEIFAELHIPTTGPNGIRYSDALKDIRIKKKSGCINYMEYMDDVNRHCPPNWDKIFTAYIVKQRKYNKLDFSDLIYLTLYVLKKYPVVLKKWGERIVYVLVDETQDNSDNQWQIAYKISEPNQNLFVVGDPDQAIYLWRGAAPSYLIDMNAAYPATKTIILDSNYRSYQSILTASNNLIYNNKNRLEKEMKAMRAGDSTVWWHHAKSEKEETEWIVKKIKEIYTKEGTYNNTAILYRSSNSSRLIEQILAQNKIPYIIYGGTRFFEREEIKDTIAYIKLIELDDNMSFLRIINKPKRKLGPSFVDTVKKLAEVNDCSLFEALSQNLSNPRLDKPEARWFCRFINDCRALKTEFSISDIAEYILDTSGIRTTLKNNGDEERMENLKELVNAIKFYEEEHEGENITFASYIQDIALLTNMDYQREQDWLRIMTIHQSKGLEFPNVFISGLSEGIFPNSKTLRGGDLALEEERRVMYVAMTRAKDNLYFTDSEGYNATTGDAKQVSRFIYECKIAKLTPESVPVTGRPRKPNIRIPLNRELPQYNIGDKIFHHLFEWGQIVGISDDELSYKIEFEHSGFKLIRIGTIFEKVIK